MNWRRGFLRLWIIFSVAWVAFLYFDGNPGRNAYDKAIADLPMGAGVVVPITASSEEIRNALLDYYREMAPAKTIDATQIASDAALVRAEINRMVAWNEDGRRAQWREFAIWSVAAPGVVLILGAVVGWVLSGFRARATKQ